VQNAQRFAIIGIVDRHCGQAFVVGSAGGATSALFSLFILRTNKNTAKATIKKLMIVLTKTP
jgi:hypothetical protein